MVFSPAQSQSPVYTRSRASFLTGRYPRTIRCRQNGQDIPADEVLATKLQADAGQLFDLAADSGETRNLWNEAAARTAKAELNPSQPIGWREGPTPFRRAAGIGDGTVRAIIQCTGGDQN